MMSSPADPGRRLFARTMPPIDRTMLALYAGGSNDHSPVHFDSDAARASGFDDVFAQGMCVMALLGRCLTDEIGPDRLKSYSARFVARTLLGDQLTCTATIEETRADGDFRVGLMFANQHGEVKLRGTAVIAK